MTNLNAKWAIRVRFAEESAAKLAQDLLTISKLAMPDTYYASDSRCRFAREILERFGKPKRPPCHTEKRHAQGVCACKKERA